jgi:AAA ATPase domain/Bacterial transcriptional activator domain
MPFSVEVLGALVVKTSAGAVDMGGPKRSALLTALIVGHAAPQPADVLIERVYGNQTDLPGPGALRVHMSRLRSLCNGEIPLEHSGGGYQLLLDTTNYDSLRFEELVGEANRRAESRQWVDAGLAYDSALRLWRGEPFRYSDLEAAQECSHRLGALYRATRFAALVSRLTVGDHGRAIELSESWTFSIDESSSVRSRAIALCHVGRVTEARWLLTQFAAKSVDETGFPDETIDELLRKVSSTDRSRSIDVPPFVAPGQGLFSDPTRRRPSRSKLSVFCRNDEVAKLLGVLKERPRAARCMWVTGPVGYGKTSLVESVVGELAQLGLVAPLFLKCAAQRIVDLLAISVDEHQPDDLLDPHQRSVAQALLVRASVEALLGWVASAETPVLVVDDAHLIDAVTASVVKGVLAAGGAENLTVLLVESSDGDGDGSRDRLASLIDEWRIRSTVLRFDVGPLDRSVVRAEVTNRAMRVAGFSDSFDGELLVDQIMRLSNGRPAEVARLLDVVMNDPGASLEDGWSAQVSAELSTRISAVSMADRLLIDMLSVSRPLSLALLSAVIERRQEEVASSVDQLESVGLLRWVEGDEVRVDLFDQSVGGAVQLLMSPSRIRLMHQLIAEAQIAGEHDAPASIMSHLLAAGSDAGRVAFYAEAAINEALAAFDVDAAVARAEQMCSLSFSAPVARVRSQLSLATALRAAGQDRRACATARLVFDECLVLGDELVIGQATDLACGAYASNQIDEGALSFIDRAVESLTDPGLRSKLFSRAAVFSGTDSSRVKYYADLALADAEKSSDAVIVGRALHASVLANVASSDVVVRLAMAERELDIVRSTRDFAAEFLALGDVAHSAACLGDIDRVAYCLGAMDVVRRQVTDPVTSWWWMGWRVLHLSMLRRIDEAEAVATEQREWGLRAGVKDAEAWYFAQLYFLRRADHRLTELSRLFRADSPAVPLAWRAMTASVQVAAGDARTAQVLADEIDGGLLDQTSHDHQWVATLVLLRETFVHANLTDSAAVVDVLLQPHTDGCAVYGAGCGFLGIITA